MHTSRTIIHVMVDVLRPKLAVHYDQRTEAEALKLCHDNWGHIAFLVFVGKVGRIKSCFWIEADWSYVVSVGIDLQIN